VNTVQLIIAGRDPIPYSIQLAEELKIWPNGEKDYPVETIDVKMEPSNWASSQDSYMELLRRTEYERVLRPLRRAADHIDEPQAPPLPRPRLGEIA
jgi:hypothetical protein